MVQRVISPNSCHPSSSLDGRDSPGAGQRPSSQLGPRRGDIFRRMAVVCDRRRDRRIGLVGDPDWRSGTGLTILSRATFKNAGRGFAFLSLLNRDNTTCRAAINLATGAITSPVNRLSMSAEDRGAG